MDIGSGPAGGIGVSYPASLAQARFWVLDALDPGTPSLNVAVRWTLLGAVTVEAVEAAFRRIMSRHDILRTALVEEDGSPVQVVRTAVPFGVRHFDLTQSADAPGEADRIGEEEARTPFCLEAPPLLRVALITLGPDRSRLLLTLHHAVCDGWSIGVIADEFMAALNGAARLEDLPLQYSDFAQWQQAWLESPALDEATQYWKRQLAALPYMRVEPDHEAQDRGAGAIESVLLPRALTETVAAAASRAGCTPFAVALAALGRVLHVRTGAVDIAIGTQVAGRTEIELERMVGPFINTLVLRLDLAGQPDWNEQVRRAASTVAGALNHHEMPFEVLIRTLNPPRLRGRTPLFSVNFIFQRSFVAPGGGGITLVDMPSHSAGALYDLNFFMVERSDGWRASCEYDTALFEPGTIRAMLADWSTAMSGLAIQAPSASDPVQQRLAAIWREVLAVPDVTPADSFFDLGGHSLLAARMLAKVEATFGRRIGMSALFLDPTLEGMAAQLRGRPLAAGSGPHCIAVGDPAEWHGLAAALGQATHFTCMPEDALEEAAGLAEDGRQIVFGTGGGAAAAVQFARGRLARGGDVSLVLVDPAAPKSGFLARLRPGRAAGSFQGRALLVRTASASADGLAAWTSTLAGPLEVVPVPTGPWQDVVAARLAA